MSILFGIMVCFLFGYPVWHLVNINLKMDKIIKRIRTSYVNGGE